MQSKEPIRIGLCGAHSTGKSTLAEAINLAGGLPLIKGVTRQTPTELRGTPAGQWLILLDYLEAFSSRGDCSWVCDRTIIDVCCYSQIYGVWHSGLSEQLIRAYRSTRYAPTHLIYLPIEFPMVQDGERPPEKMREEFDACATDLLKRCWPDHLRVTGSVVERLKQVKSFTGGF